MWKRLKEGNGTAYISAFLMTFILCCTMMLIHNVLVYQNALTTQTAIDSIADGAALKDYLNKSSYEESLENIQRMEELIKQHIGVEVKDITSDPDSYSKRQVVVKGTTSLPFFTPFLGSGSIDITRDATTQFARRSYGEDMLSFMVNIASDDRFGYSMESRDLRDGDSTDCSGLAYFAALCTGYPIGPGPFCSSEIASAFQAIGFERIPITQFNSVEDFVPGDILYYAKEDHGTEFGHVETVFSINPLMTVGAHGYCGNHDPGDASGDEISVRPATFEDLRYNLYVAVLRATPEANRMRNMDKSTWPTIHAQDALEIPTDRQRTRS